MKKFFDFASLAYIVVFCSAMLLANNLCMEIPNGWVGWILTAISGVYLGYNYAMKD